MANPAKSTVLLDASSMKRVLDPATTDRRLFDLVVESCGRFVRWPQAETEYPAAVRGDGGDPNRLLRILDGLPGDKRLRCGRSAMQAQARKRRAVRLLAGFHRTDRHLLWAALARHASYVITGDRGVLACAGAIEQCLGIRIRKPEEFLRECGVAGW